MLLEKEAVLRKEGNQYEKLQVFYYKIIVGI